MGTELIEQAQSRGLRLLEKFLTEHPMPEPTSLDPILEHPLATEPMAALEQMFRRGLHPELVRVLLEWLHDRPLERGLLAWDALCGSLLRRDDDALLEELRTAAQPIRDVVPAIGEGYIYQARVSPVEMVERLAVPPFRGASDELLQAGFVGNALGAIEVLREEMGQDYFVSSSIPEKLGLFAKSLSLAHLPTLASFYQAYLWRAFDYTPALAEYADVLLDADAKVGLPRGDQIIVTGAPEEVDLEAYIIGRTVIRQGRQRELVDAAAAAPDGPDYSKESPAEVSKINVRSQVVLAEAGVAVGELSVPFEVMSEIIRQNPGWRYARRVFVLMVARFAEAGSDAPIRAFQDFVAGFGNDGELWLLLARYAPEGASWWEAVQARAVGEVTMLPYDRHAWAGLIAATKAEKSSLLLDELANRIDCQCPKA